MKSKKITIKKYSELSKDELFDILKLRQDVFVIEQSCPYEDIDVYDKVAFHLLYFNSGKLIATSRILEENTKFDCPSIGRIATDLKHRGKGEGKGVIEASIRFIEDELKALEIKISAQEHLESYYNKFSFERCSEPYDDEGIMHIDMIRKGSHARNR